MTEEREERAGAPDHSLLVFMLGGNSGAPDHSTQTSPASILTISAANQSRLQVRVRSLAFYSLLNYSADQQTTQMPL